VLALTPVSGPRGAGAFDFALRAAAAAAGRDLSQDAVRGIMVGDSVPCDVRGAASCGLHAVLVDRKGKHSAVEGCSVVRSLSEVEGVAQAVSPRLWGWGAQVPRVASPDDVS